MEHYETRTVMFEWHLIQLVPTNFGEVRARFNPENIHAKSLIQALRYLTENEKYSQPLRELREVVQTYHAMYEQFLGSLSTVYDEISESLAR
jgi:hypothetical protein